MHTITQFDANLATMREQPPLADSYVLGTSETMDGYIYGPPWPLEMDPQSDQRRAVLGSHPVDGVLIFGSFRR